MKYKFGVVKRITLLLMTMALAVAMVACEAAAGKPGEAGTPGQPGQPGAPGEPGGVPPSLDEAIGDQKLAASGAMATMDIDLNVHFYDPDGAEGESLTYAASSSDTEKVTATVTGSTLTLTAVAVGTAKITVRATDVDGLSSGSARFDVTVAETAPPQNTAIFDQEIYQADGAKTITLADHFMHTSTITYSVSSSPVGVVTAAIAEGVLTLTPLVMGQTIVTVTATADDQSIMDDFIVTVKAGSKPALPVTPSAPPAAVGTIMAQEVEIGASLPAMDVSAYFSPTGLTYTAVPSDATKATATIPVGSSSLTIAGVAIGTATVTVTATDSGGRMASQTISVTVTAASAPYKPPTVMIAGVTKTYDVSIDPGQTLQPLHANPNEVYVRAARKSGSATVWTLTGVQKTPATAPERVRIREADGSLDREILVTVENTAPKVKSNYPTVIIPASTGAAATTTSHVYVDEDGKITDGGTDPSDTTANDGKRLYHKFRFNYKDYFTDADGDALLSDIDDETGYFARSEESYINVVKAQKDGVVVDVTKDVGGSFTLTLHVVDKSGAMSDVATISAEAPGPIADLYEVRQDLHDGDFGNATVSLREDVEHTLTFAAFGSDRTTAGNEGFRFIHVFEEDQVGAGYTLSGSSVAQNALVKLPDTRPAAATGDVGAVVVADPAAYLIISKTGSVDITGTSVDGVAANTVDLIDTDNIPTLTFEVTGTGRASVTVTYHRVVGKDGDDDGTDIDRADEHQWISDEETLEINIVPSR